MESLFSSSPTFSVFKRLLLIQPTEMPIYSRRCRKRLDACVVAKAAYFASGLGD
jgi:hypothetical protein